MGEQMNSRTIEDLRGQVARICAGEGEFQDITKVKGLAPLSPGEIAVNPQFANVPAPPAAREEPPLTFGRWLLDQEPTTEDMFLLIDCARRDPRFPVSGDVEDIRRRLRACGAEGELLDALGLAELEWVKVDPSIPF